MLLTISGAVPQTNATAPDGTAVAQFDRAMLDAIGLRTLVTHTIWTEGPQTFVGVPLKALAEHVGVTGGTLSAIAVNDYAIDIPFEDLADDAAVLALDRNGAPMSVRDKGPLWLVFPYDDDPRYRTETYHARSIWQMVRIDVKP